MLSRDTFWIIGAMLVFAALLFWRLHVGFTDLTDQQIFPAIPRDTRAVLCYEASGENETDIVREIETLLADRDRQTTSCGFTCRIDDIVDLETLDRELAQIAIQYEGRLAYVLAAYRGLQQNSPVLQYPREGTSDNE